MRLRATGDEPFGFGELLRAFRSAAGFSQEVLAERARISVEAVGALERGTHRAPHRHTLALLAEALELTDLERAQLNAAAVRARARSTRRDASAGGHVEPMPETQAAWDRVERLPGRRESAVATIDQIDDQELEEFWSRVKPRLAGVRSVEEAAHHLVDALYTRFTSSLVLARAFGTIEARRLPLEERACIERSVAREGNDDIDATTPILTLLASRGVERAWNDRKRSRGHRAIPLISKRQIAGSPMIAKLLEEIGFTADWREPHDGFAMKTFSNVSGIFYVADASRALDDQGRHVIPATEFVRKYAVATVFGFGGLYVGRHMSISVVLFCRSVVARRQAMQFVPIIEAFKDATKHLVNRGAILTSLREA